MNEKTILAMELDLIAAEISIDKKAGKDVSELEKEYDTVRNLLSEEVI